MKNCQLHQAASFIIFLKQHAPIMFFSSCYVSWKYSSTRLVFFTHKFTLYIPKKWCVYIASLPIIQLNLSVLLKTQSDVTLRPSKPMCACEMAEALESIDSQWALHDVHHNYFHKRRQTVVWVYDGSSQTSLSSFLPFPVSVSHSCSLSLCLLTRGLTRCPCRSRCSGAWLELEDSSLRA